MPHDVDERRHPVDVRVCGEVAQQLFVRLLRDGEVVAADAMEGEADHRAAAGGFLHARDQLFAGGIDEGAPPVLVAGDGTFAAGGYPWAPALDGGFTVLELPSREEAVAWAARLARACRCDQELRVFMFDPNA